MEVKATVILEDQLVEDQLLGAQKVISINAMKPAADCLPIDFEVKIVKDMLLFSHLQI